MKPGFGHILDEVSSSHNLNALSLLLKDEFNKLVIRMNTLFTDIFYQAHALIPASSNELEASMFAASTLGVMPRCLPSILSS
jgi:hypothetical protein